MCFDKAVRGAGRIRGCMAAPVKSGVMMDCREKDERNICCALCSESGKSPEYEPEIHHCREGRMEQGERTGVPILCRVTCPLR